jgi:uncharacterized OB-fold protein
MEPIDPTLFASLDPPRLAGSRCERCDTVTFPVSGSCPKCTNPEMARYPLPDRGTVWTYTVQGFPPKAPYVPPAGGFQPFPVGYVDLGEVLVEAHLLADPERLRIGLPVHLVLEPTATGTVTYAFAEVSE